MVALCGSGPFVRVVHDGQVTPFGVDQFWIEAHEASARLVLDGATSDEPYPQPAVCFGLDHSVSYPPTACQAEDLRRLSGRQQASLWQLQPHGSIAAVPRPGCSPLWPVSLELRLGSPSGRGCSSGSGSGSGFGSDLGSGSGSTPPALPPGHRRCSLFLLRVRGASCPPTRPPVPRRLLLLGREAVTC